MEEGSDLVAGTINVVGGGLAGLAVALAAARAGWEVTICEQVPQLAATGAGLTMAPSAIAGLRALRLGDEFAPVAELSSPPVMLDWKTGAALALPPSQGGQHLGEVRRILRSDLHAILAEAVARERHCTLRLGTRVTNIERSEGGATAHFADGAKLESAILLGADGIRSRVRSHVAGPERPAFTGYVAWRFLLPIEVGGPLLGGREVAITAGPRASLTCYTIGHGRLVNCVAIVAASGWAEEGWTIAGDRAELARHFAEAHEDARAIVAAAPGDKLFKWALFDREPTFCWVRGRAALLGDAAHPVLPFLGLGAGLAIEDAVVLGRCLAEFSPDAALAAFERTRAPRAALIQRLSRAQGEAFARVGGDRKVAPAPFFDRAIFDYDPATVPLA